MTDQRLYTARLMPNPPKSVGLLRKFVSTARSITTGQVSMPLGILRLCTNLYWLKQYDINPLTGAELEIIEAYHAQIIDYPLDEKERSYWSSKALQKQEEELKELSDLYHPQLMPILARVVVEAT